MVSSSAQTVDEYLGSLPPDRRSAIAAVRDRVNARLPRGYEEGVQYGMITWYIPLKRYPDTYNGQPLAIASLASQKRHMALYMLGVYGDPDVAARFERDWAATGKKLDMGKSCLRFERLEDLALDVVGDAMAALTPEAFIARYEAARAGTAAGKKKAAKNGAAKPKAARAAKAGVESSKAKPTTAAAKKSPAAKAKKSAANKSAAAKAARPGATKARAAAPRKQPRA